MSIWHEISSTFWSTSFWFPKSTTWADVAPGSRANINHADYRDLMWSLPIAIALFVIRYGCENYIFSAFGQWLGIKSTRSIKQPSPNRMLEAAYIKCNRLDESRALGLAKQLDSMTQREIERWWRLRQAQDKPTTISKFCESSWRCLYYSCSFSFGLIVLWGEPWLWDFELCWLGYPHHSVDGGVWFYYMVSLSLYLSLFVSQFFDVKRKDFWMLFAHHIATILVITLSWITHFHRIGSLVLLCHDIADIILEAAKVAKYAKYQRCYDIIVAVFVIVWIVSRLYVYPQMVYNSLTGTSRFQITSPVSQIVNSLLLLLQCMHIVWTYMIFQMIFVALKEGGMKKDYRSSSESDEDCCGQKTIFSGGFQLV